MWWENDQTETSARGLTRSSRVALLLFFGGIFLLVGVAMAASAHADGPSGEPGERENVLQRTATGAKHTCVLKAGDVYCWGEGADGQLGYGNTLDVGDDETPAQVGPVDLGAKAISIVAGSWHTCALLETHDVRCWGRGTKGQLGYGNTDTIGDNEVPASVPIVNVGPKVVAISAGGDTTCALTTSGRIRCWGSNDSGQLGLGNLNRIGDNESPASVPPVDLGGDEALAIDVGDQHVCAVMEDGTVACWGEGADGRLGYGNTSDVGGAVAPGTQRVRLGAAALSVTAGNRHTCALLDVGVVRCWGFGGDGRLGNGSLATVGDNEPVSTWGDDPVSPGTVWFGYEADGQDYVQVIGISAAGAHTCAVLDNGDVRCWGLGHPALGVQTTQVIGDSRAEPGTGPAVALGNRALTVQLGAEHACAELADGEITCWGIGADGRLGYGNTSSIGDDEDPSEAGHVQIGADHEIKAIAAGGSHTCALRDDGTVVCWGSQGPTPAIPGVLGLGHKTDLGDNEHPGDLEIALGGPVKAIAAGDLHTCAVLADGRVRCWGKGADGRLGLANVEDIGDDERPVDVATVRLPAEAVTVVAGGKHTCALLVNGKVSCWGANGNGQLGLQSTIAIGDNEHPDNAASTDLGGEVRSIAAGLYHNCAVLTAGDVVCWGTASLGRLGYGNRTVVGDNEAPSSAGPVDLGPGRHAVEISAGLEHTCARADNGSVYCWGSHQYGQLGYGTREEFGGGAKGIVIDNVGDDETPADVGPVNLGRAAWSIALGRAHTCIIAGDGTVHCWGSGSKGQLGYGNTSTIGDDESAGTSGNVNLGARRALAIAGGADHTCALLADGTVQCWGDGASGRLGHANQVTIGDNEVPSSAGLIRLFGPAPQAVDDTLTLHEDSGNTTVGVLGNDVLGGDVADPDVSAEGAYAPDVTTVGVKRVLSVTQPSHGLVSINHLDGIVGAALTYAPTPGYCNSNGGTPDVFTYALNGGSTATATVNITCTAADDSVTILQDSGSGAIDVLGNDTEPEGAAAPKVASTTEPYNGNVAIDVTGSQLYYVPDPGYCTPADATEDQLDRDEFSYSLVSGDTATVRVTVLCSAGPPEPVATDDTSEVMHDSGPTIIDVLANDTGSAAEPTPQVLTVSQPAHGSVVVTGSGVSYTPATGYCNRGSGATDPSPDVFGYSITGGATATVAVIVDCVMVDD
jgi:alpha-tubulin suppressor-like RCC1 family protein